MSERFRGLSLDTASPLAIQRSLEDDNLKQWGFVIYRCTYSSQERWEKFISTIKEHAKEYLNDREMNDLWNTMIWTIIEDPETLDGASIEETTRRFKEWLETEGREEMKGSAFANVEWVYYPRYTYFVTVDEESVESVVDDAKAREDEGYYFTVVRAGSVGLEEEQERIAREENGEDDENEELEEEEDEDEDENDRTRDEESFKKRFKADVLARLYGVLLHPNHWYNMYVPDAGVTDLWL